MSGPLTRPVVAMDPCRRFAICTLPCAGLPAGLLPFLLATPDTPAPAHVPFKGSIAITKNQEQAFMKKHLLFPALTLLPLLSAAQALVENFDDVTTLATSGWTMTNQSTPVGTGSWFQGNAGVFPSHNGADTAYVGVNFNSITGSGEISNWLITPAVNVQDGDILAFWTSTSTGSTWNDRLEVRASAGTMTMPAGASDVGSFTDLLLTVNDGYDLSYPESWTRYEIVVAGVGTTPVAMHYAFRYNVADGGPSGTNSNYIGIDAVFIGDPGNQPPAELCTPVLDCTDGDVITNVTFGDINNDTGCSPDGYGDYTSMSTTVQADSFTPISVTVGDGWPFESVSVWIDLDNSSTFDANEFTFIATGTDEALTGSIGIPAGTPDGTYRMRVRLAAVDNTTATSNMACDASQEYGETEDYTVVVGTGTGIGETASNGFSFHPNPVQDLLQINTTRQLKAMAAYTMLGRAVALNTPVNDGRIDVSALASGVYVFQLTFVDGSVETFRVTKQ